MATPMAVDVGPQGCIFNYHYTVHQPTAVTYCAVGNFTSSTDVNLIIGRSTHLDIQVLTPEGLKSVLTTPLYGVISALRLFRPKAASKDFLLILTEHYKFAVLEFSPAPVSGGVPELVTRAAGDVKDAIGRPVEAGQLAAVDPDCRSIALHLYDGQLKVLQLDEGSPSSPIKVAPETFNVRLEELAVIDLAFLAPTQTSRGGGGAGSNAAAAAGSHAAAAAAAAGGGGGGGAVDNPVLALLYEDNKHARHVKTYTLNLRTKELEDGPWHQANLEAGSSKIIPVPAPLGGAIVVGESVITYFNTQQPTRSTQIKANTAIQSWCTIDEDGSRYLLSDFAGGLHLLVLAHADNRVAGIKVQTLGRTTSTSCMAYLDSGYVFLGSRGGDSQLIRLHEQPLPPPQQQAAAAADAAAAGGAGGGGALDAQQQPQSAAGAAGPDDDPMGVVPAAVAAAGGSSEAAAAAAAAAGVGVGDEGPNYVEVVDSWPSLAPILDFAVVDLERQGQGQMVACSGAFQDGSLRVVRNGIGVHEAASMELPGIKGVWSVRNSWMDAYDSHLVLSFVGETRLLAISEEDVLDEAVIPGFDGDSQTLLAATTLHDHLLQVTSSAVRLVSPSTGQLLHQWSPATATANSSDGSSSSSSITLAAASPCQVLVAAGGGRVWLLEVSEGGQLVEVTAAVMEAEVACLDITPVGPDASASNKSSLAVIGSWSRQVTLLSLPALQPVATEDLGSEIIPRSVALADFEGQGYVLCGLGDGQLHNWRLEPESGVMSEHKKVVLGTKPILLSPFSSGGQRHVFAASDRPTIIYSNNKKLLYSNLNENDVAYLASFSTSSLPDSLALVKGGSLSLGTIDGIQKLHIRTVPLGEQPRRICHQSSTKTLGVVTISTAAGPGPTDVGRSHLRIFDDSTFDLLASYPLGQNEIPNAVASMSFGGGSNGGGGPSGSNADSAAAAAAAAGVPSSSGAREEEPPQYFIVGTAIIKPNEVEPSKGHILVLSYSPTTNKLTLVEQLEVHGSVYNLASFQGKLLVAVNNKVMLYTMSTSQTDGRQELVSDCSPVGVQVLCLYLAVRGDFVIVGDLMKSITLLFYKAAEGALEVCARDQDSKWLTALALLDDDTFIAADNGHNLVVVRKNPDATTDEERSRLETVGRFHTGVFINRISQGSLVMRLPDSELSGVPTCLYGGASGAVGLVASLPRDLYEMLAALQNGLKKVIRGVGGFDHDAWRAFKDERRTEPATNFVDGDLVEQFLDLGPDKAAEVVGAVWPNGEFGVQEVQRRLEELQRLH